MSRSLMRVIYDGPAVEDGEMDVAQLAPSLLALGKLLENADNLLTGEQGRIRVRVQSDVRLGSFDVGIAVDINTAWDAAKAWILSETGATTLGLLGILGFNLSDSGKGVIQVVRWLRRRKVARKTILKAGNTQLETDDGDTLVIPTPVARLIDEPQIRQPLERFTEPLREEGVDAIKFETDSGDPMEQIVAAEASSFEATAGAAPTSTSRFQATYQIKRLHFDEGKKWRLSSGAQAIQAEIVDRAFWERIANSEEAFSKDDFLVCDVRMDQWLGPNGLKTEYAVERVVSHIPAPTQKRFLDD